MDNLAEEARIMHIYHEALSVANTNDDQQWRDYVKRVISRDNHDYLALYSFLLTRMDDKHDFIRLMGALSADAELDVFILKFFYLQSGQNLENSTES